MRHVVTSAGVVAGMSQYRRVTAVLATVLALIVAAGLYYVFLVNHPQNTPEKPRLSRLCYLEPSLDEGVERVFVRTLNGSRACPVMYSVEIRLKEGYRLRSATVGGKAFKGLKFNVLVSENETLKVETERIKIRVEILSNATGAYALVNGANVSLPYSLEVDYGEWLNVTPIEVVGLKPLNGTVILRPVEDISLKLYYINASSVVKGVDWRFNGSLPSCEGVLVYSNARLAWAIVDGRNVTLPYCASNSVEVEGSFELPLNKTHSLWLAWYNASGTVYPYFESEKIEVKDGVVELHYVVGLRGLPYVARLDLALLRDWYEAYRWNVSVEDGWIRLTPGTYMQKWGLSIYGFVFIVLPDKANKVWVEIMVEKVETDRSIEAQVEVTPLYLVGQKFCGAPCLAYPFNDTPKRIRASIDLRLVRTYWSVKKVWDESIGYRYPDYCLPDEFNSTLENLVWKISSIYFAHRTLDLQDIEWLPNTGETGLLISIDCYSRQIIPIKIRIIGVSP